MAEELKVSIGIELNDGELEKIRSEIKNLETEPIKIKFDGSEITKQISKIKSELKSLGDMKINIGGNGSNSSVKSITETTKAYKDLMTLAKQINNTRVKIAGLDGNKDAGQIKELSAQLNRLQADYNNLYSTFGKSFSTDQIDNLNRAFETTSNNIATINAKMADSSAIKAEAENVKQVEQAFKELYNVARQIDSLEIKIKGLDKSANANEIAELTSQLNNLKKTYNELFTGMQGDLSGSQLQKLSQSMYDTMDKVAQLDAKIADTKAKMAQGIQEQFNSGAMSASIEKMAAQYEKLGSTGHEKLAQVKSDIESLRSIMNELGSGNLSTDQMISKWQEYETTLERVKNTLSTVKAETSQFATATEVAHLDNQMMKWLDENTAATNEYRSAVKALREELAALSGNGAVPASALKNIKNQFAGINEQAIASGKMGGTFFTNFGKGFKDVAAMYLSPMMLVMEGVQKVKEMYQNTVAVDKSMTGLRRVTNLTAKEYSEMYDDMRVSAEAYGSTLTDMIDSTTTWVKLGFNPETAKGLAETTVEYQHVTDLGTETAVDNLVTAYKGFETQLLSVSGGDATKAVEYVADIYDKLGNEFAVSAADVGTSMTKCSSTLQLAGNTIQEAAAMATGITEVTQDPAKAGSALKILSLRLRGMKGELEALGEDVDSNVESISKMQTQVLNLTHGKVNIFDDDGNFRSTYDIMNDIAEVYESLTDTEQAELLETIAGKNRANDVAALITNWEQVKAAKEAALNAHGTAAAEQEKYLASAEGHINQLKSAWEGLSVDFLSADFVKGAVDGVRSIVNMFDALTKSVGSLGAVLVSAGIFSAGKSALGGLSSFIAALPLQAKVAAVAVTGLVLAGKKLYDTWKENQYNKKYKWGEGLAQVGETAVDSYNKVKKLSDLRKEVGKLNTVITSSKSDSTEVAQAQQRLQEIAKLVKDEYGITVTADSTQLDAAIEKLEKIQLKEARGAQSGLDNKLSSNIISYKQSVSDLPSKKKEFEEAQAFSTTIQKAQDKLNDIDKAFPRNAKPQKGESVKEAEKRYAAELQAYADARNAILDLYGLDDKLAGRKFEAVNDKDSVNNTLITQMLNDLVTEYHNKIDENGDKYNLYHQYHDLLDSIEEFETARDSFIKNGLTEIEMGDEAEGVKQLSTAVKDYKASAEDTAMAAARAKNGIESFSELGGDSEKLHRALESYNNYAKEFGASAEEITQGSALIANGFDSAENAVAAGGDAINNVIKDLQKYGEKNGLFDGMDSSGIADKLTEMAHAMDLLPDTKHIEIDAKGNINVIDDVKQKVDELNNKGKIKLSIDTDGNVDVLDTADQKLRNLAEAGQIDIKFNVDTGGFDINSLAGDKLGEITADGTVKWESDTSGVETPNVNDATAKVNYEKGEQAPPEAKDADVNYTWASQDPPNSPEGANVNYALGTQAPPQNKTAYVTYVEKGGATVNGTAHVNGTAFRSGDWSTSSDGTALGGELGQELIVRDGRYFTIGDKGAEFFAYRKGDIIFNHKQTEELFKNGRVTSGGGRGRAFAEGSGRAFASGNSDKEKPEHFDWIEKLLDRIERSIDAVRDTVGDIYISYHKRNEELANLTLMLKNEIEQQQTAYDKYIAQANAVGLSEDWAAKIRDGAFQIDDITDDDLKEKIADYQEWYEKALDCQDAIRDLRFETKELHKEAFDNISKEYDGILSEFEHTANVLNERFDRAQQRGLADSSRYHEALYNNELKMIDTLKAEQQGLTDSLNQAVNSGEIEEYSEAWYDLKNEIYGVSEAIEEAKTQLVEFDNEMRQATWDRFDYALDKVSELTDESNFLIDLLSHNDMFDENGDMTKYGKATMGLHSVNYNTYMEEALAYGEAVGQINEELSKNPYDTNLLARRKELLDLQRENILAAEDEKQAIMDLINDGIEEELDSLKKLIDTYTDALDAEKELYDYRNRITDKTKEIASIQKQLAAYENDTSEETRAKVQKLKVELEDSQKDLQDMQYEQYIKDQKAMLEGLYTQYESILNEQTNNIDEYISNAIDSINDNSSQIRKTLTSATKEVGTTLSNDMDRIWKSGSAAIKEYSKNASGFYLKMDGYFATGYPTSATGLQMGIENILSGVNRVVDYASGIAAKMSNPEYYQGVMKQNSLDWYTSDTNMQNYLAGKNKSLGGWLGLWQGDDGWFDEDTLFYNVTDREKIEHMVAAMKQNSAAWATATASKRSELEAANNKMANYIAEITGKNVFKDGNGDWWIGSDKLYESYKNGAYNLNKDQLAWTQEGKKEEVIIRPSDGAILTPLKKGDNVLTAEATDNLYDFANNPNDFAKKLTEGFNIGSGSTSVIKQGDTFTGDINVELSFPNVQDYEGIRNEMAHDVHFERMIQSMTIDRLAGGSKLKKYKY